ncbi:nucleoid-associated protein [Mucilaginibacter angelicae]|uniref:Nucleoid-associated protein n=1 Tax=Mucilaginibacter angelicae TaxID=869718 RepID=A0ABV6L2A2_9SPHI
MEIKGIIIHDLKKDAGGNAKLKKASKTLVIKEVHDKFMTDVKDVYYKKSNPIYGVFDSGADSFPYQGFLNSYLKGKLSFYDFTVKAIDHFVTEINKVTQATGGNVVFCHFKTTEDFMAVIILNAKSGYVLDDNMDLRENFRLDIEKLDVANFSNCTKWENGEDVYLSFTRGKKEISNYFRDFIGCTDYNSAKESSDKLKKALNEFLIKQGTEKDEIERIKKDVFEYCEKRMNKKEDISLSQVSAIVNHDEPELFQEFASTETYQISTVFKGHPATLKSLKYYIFNSKELTIVFDSKLIANQSVVFDNKKNTLLIKDVPKKLRAQLNNEEPAEEENE